MKMFKTTKGTELPLINLKGKNYLEVKNRLIWFREERPHWGIETEMMNVTDTSAYARAVVRDETGRIVATSHKFENAKGFEDFIEKAETGAVGRALALLGYGTQFAMELEIGEESEDVVDSPVPPKTKPTPASPQRESPPSKPKPSGGDPVNLGAYVVKVGKEYKGKRLDEIDMFKLDGFIKWLISSAAKTGKPLAGDALELTQVGEAYLVTKEVRS